MFFGENPMSLAKSYWCRIYCLLYMFNGWYVIKLRNLVVTSKISALSCKMLLNLHQSSAKPQSAITGLKLNADLGRFVRDKNPNNYIYPSNIVFFVWLSVYLSFYGLQLLSWLWFFEFCWNSVVKNWRCPLSFFVQDCLMSISTNLNAI